MYSTLFFVHFFAVVLHDIDCFRLRSAVINSFNEIKEERTWSILGQGSGAI